MSPARRLLFACLALVVALAAGAVVVQRVLAHAPAAPPATVASVAQDRPGTVLLVPGYGGSTASLTGLAARLRSAGRTAVVVSLPGGGTGDLRSYVPVLDAAAQAALRGGAPSVDVVGYSAGGVITRLWEADGGAAVTRRVVTLGSPHHGTQLAAAGLSLLPGSCPEACRQLVPGSALLTALNEGDETPSGPEWLSLWTTADQTVTPPDSARLAGATNVVLQSLCPGATTSHSDLPRDERVQGVVLGVLSSGQLAAPSRCPA